MVEFGTLLGPEKTAAPVGVGGFSGRRSDRSSNASMVLSLCGVGLWVWWWRGGWGVWLCVECCIVDASILL